MFQDLPKNAALRKLNDFIKRARMAKIHAYIISELRADMPKFFGKGRKQKELIKNLPILFKKVQVKVSVFHLCNKTLILIRRLKDVGRMWPAISICAARVKFMNFKKVIFPLKFLFFFPMRPLGEFEFETPDLDDVCTLFLDQKVVG